MIIIHHLSRFSCRWVHASLQDVDMSGLVSERFSLGATFTPSSTASLSWSGLAPGEESSLGCFLLRGSPYFRAPDLVQGLRMGVSYVNTDSTNASSRMVGSVCGPSPPLLNLTAFESLRYITTPVPQGEPDRLGQTGVVCTALTVQRHNADAVSVCISTTNSAEANPICRGSASRGRLTGVFFGAEPFQSNPNQLGVENGIIKVFIRRYHITSCM
jgi:hypothetical protein